jgi:hypothetical protein
MFLTELAVWVTAPVCVALLAASYLLAWIHRERALFIELQKPARDWRTQTNRSEWLVWVDGVKWPGNCTRADAAREFEVRLTGSGAYQALQKMVVCAPLVGVLISVLNFVRFEVAGGPSSSIGELIRLVAGPLFVGVGTGSVIALTGQFFLFVTSARVARARLEAMKWFDGHIEVSLDSTAREVNRGVRDALEVYQAAALEAAAAHRESSRSLVATASQLDAAVTSFKSATATAERDLVHLSGDLRAALNPFTALAQQVPELQTAIGAASAAGTALGAVIAEKFVPGGEDLRTAASEIRTWAAVTTQHQSAIGSTLGELQQAATGLSTAVGGLVQGVSALTEASIQTRATAESSAALSKGFADFDARSLQPAARSFDALNRGAARLAGVATDMAQLMDAVKQLQPVVTALEQATGAADKVGGLPTAITSSLVQIQTALQQSATAAVTGVSTALTTQVNTQTAALRTTGQAVTDMQQQLGTALETLAKEFRQALNEILLQLKSFSTHVIRDQADELGMTLRGILTAWDNGNGHA